MGLRSEEMAYRIFWSNEKTPAFKQKRGCVEVMG